MRKIRRITTYKDHENAIEIIYIVSRFFNKTVHECIGKSKKNEVITPRHFARFFCYQNTILTAKQIGVLFSCGESAVLYTLKVIQGWIDPICKDRQMMVYNITLTRLIEAALNV